MEALEERGGEPGCLDGRGEAPPGRRPERAFGEPLEPPAAPAQERASAHVEMLAQALVPPGRDAVLEGAEQDDDGAEKDVAAEKSHRWRGQARRV